MYINGALPPDRRLETAMHELGHLVCWSLSDTVNDEAGANVAACFLRAAKDFSFAVLVYDFDNAVRDLVEDLRDIGSEDN
jgi:Zn-dependent peptidase ImmA (M78 family)